MVASPGGSLRMGLGHGRSLKCGWSWGCSLILARALWCSRECNGESWQDIEGDVRNGEPLRVVEGPNVNLKW